nr:MAG TPA: hypothetical protein [Bacteriophage sp.]
MIFRKINTITNSINFSFYSSVFNNQIFIWL